ncbi:DUF6249 domain-containing protein [Marinimicrobium sp. ABcell2]|uniref:DUF6249 domain-containing protein n=1 Tax=Marinimicrobium sp. ABcell2 TaxID=3069751 RepID=UPI0027AFFCC0|nr:DUF6249 domain-containing protein [Marinimicrobium sp. ABcell2]MDQ2077018.1 DUF6249 domain-containing protein [Marinimicrobium sp. ABcell2]
MTTILSKRTIQTALLCLLLGAGYSIADSATRLEPTGAPVPVESQTQAETQASSTIETSSTERNQGSVDQGVTEQLQLALKEKGAEGFDWGLLIPIVAIAFIFGGPIVLIIVIAVLHYRSKNRRAQIKAELTLRALETGRELPTELAEQNNRATPEDNLRKGVKNVGLGIGVVAGLSFLVGFDIGALGFVLVAIGGAQLVLWKLESPRKNDPA